MKKKITILLLTLCLTIAPMTALAAGARVESLEYEGFGVLKLDFSRDCDWYESAAIKLTGADGAELPVLILGGEEEDCYLRAKDMQLGQSYTLSFSLDGETQEIPFECKSATEYLVNVRGEVSERPERDDCDFCRSLEHDEDFCPERIDAANLPDDDADELARIFGIERCERCGGIGHDEDRCRNH